MLISIKEACRLLNDGQVVSIPTETVYGLAASLHHPQAIDRIFSLKKRPSNNPLIIHLSSVQSVSDFALKLPEDFLLLAESFWPGPLTMILPIRENQIPNQVRAGLPTAAFRIPDHSLTLKILEQVGPLVMPSANLSGKPSATQSAHVETDFGSTFPVVDGGSCLCGVESTILCHVENRWQIARLGALTGEDFAAVLGYQPERVKVREGAVPVCPGQQYRHYAPQAELILSLQATECFGMIVGFSDRTYPRASKVFSLGSSESPEEVAENLYDILRQLDHHGVDKAYVDIEVPSKGLWATIMERLTKAKAKT